MGARGYWPFRVYAWTEADAFAHGLGEPKAGWREFAVMDEAARVIASADSLEELRAVAEAMGIADDTDPEVRRYRSPAGAWEWVPTGEVF